jgi:hypothetical protein
MTDARPPRLERAYTTGQSGGRAAFAVGGALALLIAAATLSRTGGAATQPTRPDPVDATAAARAAASVDDGFDDTDAARFPFGRLRVVSPQPGASHRNDGSIRIAARGATPHRFIRAAVIDGSTELGFGTMQSNVRGVIEGSVGLLPIADASAVRLSLRDALGGEVLAEVPFELDPGLPVALVSPSGSQSVPPTDRLWVFGTTLPEIERVTLRLRQADDLVVLERTLLATGWNPRWRAFATELALPLERQRQLLWLDVSWEGGPSRSGSGPLRIPVRVSSAREQPLTKHPSTAPPP